MYVYVVYGPMGLRGVWSCATDAAEQCKTLPAGHTFQKLRLNASIPVVDEERCEQQYQQHLESQISAVQALSRTTSCVTDPQLSELGGTGEGHSAAQAE
jgi:hypothetical protein